jgi:hypothetical protein
MRIILINVLNNLSVCARDFIWAYIFIFWDFRKLCFSKIVIFVCMPICSDLFHSSECFYLILFLFSLWKRIQILSHKIDKLCSGEMMLLCKLGCGRASLGSALSFLNTWKLWCHLCRLILYVGKGSNLEILVSQSFLWGVMRRIIVLLQ